MNASRAAVIQHIAQIVSACCDTHCFIIPLRVAHANYAAVIVSVAVGVRLDQLPCAIGLALYVSSLWRTYAFKSSARAARYTSFNGSVQSNAERITRYIARVAFYRGITVIRSMLLTHYEIYVRN